MSTNPKILNLDDLETPDNDIAIVHAGISHGMRVLTVEQFIAQQKRAAETDRLQAEALKEGAEHSEDNSATVVEIIRDSIQEFFPTLPVGELTTTKLFQIFGWLNDLTAKMNEVAAADVIEADQAADAEGNVTGETQS